MLEYNADTPSMIVESGLLQYDWWKTKYAQNSPVLTHQANYISEALGYTLLALKDLCLKDSIYGSFIGLLYINDDDENTQTMQYLMAILQRFTNRVELSSTAYLKLMYDHSHKPEEGCIPQW